MLTPKREKFCQEMIKPKTTQIRAYRAAFNATNMSRAAIDTEASKLMKEPEITLRIEALLKPVVEKVQLAREQWLEDGLRLYRPASLRQCRRATPRTTKPHPTRLGMSTWERYWAM